MHTDINKALATIVLNGATKTQCIGINTPQPTPLNRNAVLWRLFEAAKIEMPAAEAYEYHQIEQEQAAYNRARDREIEALMRVIYGDAGLEGGDE